MLLGEGQGIGNVNCVLGVLGSLGIKQEYPRRWGISSKMLHKVIDRSRRQTLGNMGFYKLCKELLNPRMRVYGEANKAQSVLRRRMLSHHAQQQLPTADGSRTHPNATASINHRLLDPALAQQCDRKVDQRLGVLSVNQSEPSRIVRIGALIARVQSPQQELRCLAVIASPNETNPQHF